MDTHKSGSGSGSGNFESELENAVSQGGNPTERVHNVFTKLSDMISKHSAEPDQLRNLSQHLRSNGRSIAQSIIKT